MVANASLTLPLSAYGDLSVTGYDVMHSFRQPLDHHIDGDTLVVPNLLVRDYPLVLRLAPVKRLFLPMCLNN
jgi:hypothetical protein